MPFIAVLRWLLIFVQLAVIIRLVRSPLRSSFPVFGAFATVEILSRIDFQPLRSVWIHGVWATFQLPLLILSVLVIAEAVVHATMEMDSHERWLLTFGVLTVSMIPLLLLSFPNLIPLSADASSLYFRRLLTARRSIHGWCATSAFVVSLYAVWCMRSSPPKILPHLFLLGGYFTLYLGTESPVNFSAWIALRKVFLLGAIAFWVAWFILLAPQRRQSLREGS